MPIEVVSKQMQQGSFLKLIFSIRTGRSKCKTPSESFKVDNLAEVWFNFKTMEELHGFNTQQTTYVSMRFRKHNLAKDCSAKLFVICEALKYSDEFVCPELSTYWIDMGSYTVNVSDLYTLEIHLNVNKTAAITFSKLYHDTEVTDFLLKADDGSVAVHKACLAAHSDVFKSMLNGEWKEIIDGGVELKGATLQTLQHLKEYLYLGTLPKTGLEPLLLLARCYMVETLKEDCIAKLAHTVTYLNLYALLQFACENNLPEFAFMLLQVTPRSVIDSVHQSRRLKEGGHKADEEPFKMVDLLTSKSRVCVISAPRQLSPRLSRSSSSLFCQQYSVHHKPEGVFLDSSTSVVISSYEY